MRILNAPGLHGSGPAHWQTLWELDPTRGATITRTTPTSWDAPDPADWLATLRTNIVDAGQQTLVVAHSLACIVMAEILGAERPSAAERLCAGVVLVAPPDPHGAGFHSVVDSAFHTMATARLNVPALIIASTDDPYATPDATEALARIWGADLAWVGAKGHINAQSGLGDWPQGWALVENFAASLDAVSD